MSGDGRPCRRCGHDSAVHLFEADGPGTGAVKGKCTWDTCCCGGFEPV